jgi:hypothetical protein
MKTLILFFLISAGATSAKAVENVPEILAQLICFTNTTGENASSQGDVFIFTQQPGSGVSGKAIAETDTEEYQNTIVTPDLKFRMQYYQEAGSSIDELVKLNAPLANQGSAILNLVEELRHNSVDLAPTHSVLLQRQMDGVGIGNFNDSLGDGLQFKTDDMKGSLNYEGMSLPVSCYGHIISQ